jgi:hypothetical protein
MIDYAILPECQNLSESYGEICVKCNKCGRFTRDLHDAVVELARARHALAGGKCEVADLQGLIVHSVYSCVGFLGKSPIERNKKKSRERVHNPTHYTQTVGKGPRCPPSRGAVASFRNGEGALKRWR